MKAQRETSPRAGSLRRSLTRGTPRLPRVADFPAFDPALLEQLSKLSAANVNEGRAILDSDDHLDLSKAPVSTDALEKCSPDRSLRFAFSPRRNWRDWALGCLIASIVLHGGILAGALWFHTPEELKAGAEEAIPIEFVVSGSDADRNASREGAQAAQVDVPPPELPEIPPVDVAQELPKVDVPQPPETPPVEIAQELPTVSPPPPPDAPAIEIPPPPAVATIDLPPPPDAPMLADLTPPVLAVAPSAPEEDAVPPVHAIPKPAEPPKEPVQAAVAPPEKKIEQPKPIAPKPVAAKPEPKKPEPRKPEPLKVEPRKIEPRQITARPVQEKPAPRAAPVDAPAAPVQQAGRGRGQAGSGESDRNSVASTRGGAAAVADYRAQVKAHLARFKVYPPAARDRDIQGRPVVAFTLSRSGGVLSASLSASSGASVLDQATLAMVRRAAPFPPAPVGASTSFNILINYNLR